MFLSREFVSNLMVKRLLDHWKLYFLDWAGFLPPLLNNQNTVQNAQLGLIANMNSRSLHGLSTD